MYILESENLNKTYAKANSPVYALKDVSFKIPKGKIIALHGPSGSGKSTLLNILGLLDQANSGHMSIFGKSIAGLNLRQLAEFRREKLGFIFQNFNLLPELKAVENVELSLIMSPLAKKTIREKALNMLAHVGLEDRAFHFPAELSGGQQQRVGVARALVHKPALVLADEPTANLDSESAFQILALIKELACEEKTSFLFSTHDVRILEVADECYELKDGELQA